MTEGNIEGFTLETPASPHPHLVRAAEEKLIRLVKENYGRYDAGDLTLICAKAINTLRKVAAENPVMVPTDFWVRISLITVLTESLFVDEGG